jgi:hypothetical protein
MKDYIENKDVQVCEVIVSNQLLRGNGKNDPYRRVLQVFDKEGNFIAEKDSETFTNTDLVHFAKHCLAHGVRTPDLIEVKSWLDSI